MAPDPQETVADTLARRVPQAPSAHRLVQALRELGAVDRAEPDANKIRLRR